MGFGPRIGFAYSFEQKTVIRANFARSFSQVTTTTGSTHQKGFTQTTSFGTNSGGLTPTFLLKDGLPSYPVPPFISPSFQNGADMPWWQNGEVTRMPEQLSWNLSIQRQLTSSLVLDASYNAVVGTHLQAGILNYNQVPTQYASRYPQLGLSFNIPAQRAQAEALGLRCPTRTRRRPSQARANGWLTSATEPPLRSASSLPAVHRHQHMGRQRRSQRPFQLSRRGAQAG